LDISIPTVLNTPQTAEPSQQLESDTDTTENIDSEEEENIDEKNINDSTIPAVITLPEAEEENWLESESNCSTVEDKPVIIQEQEEMAITPIEFLKLASSLIPEFDGKAENLKSFLDSLNSVNSLKESHEALTVNLSKTKLKGHARNLKDNENSISEIIEKLKNKGKGESVDVISAKLLIL